jgi:hypothetical protein
MGAPEREKKQHRNKITFWRERRAGRCKAPRCRRPAGLKAQNLEVSKFKFRFSLCIDRGLFLA